MFAEPPRTNYDLNFVLFGIPVRIHWAFWLVAILLGIGINNLDKQIDPARVLIWVVVVFVSILVHELGHVFAYRRFGTNGRIVLYWLGGLAIRQDNYSSSFYSSRESSPQAQIIISLAGPAAGLALYLVVAAVVTLSGHGDFVVAASVSSFGIDLQSVGIPLAEPFATPQLRALIYSLIAINLMWSVVNLLPVYPLDGGQVSRELCVMNRPSGGIELSLQISIVTGIVMAVLGLIWFGQLLILFLFGSLAYSSYQALQSYRGYGGGFGGRGW